MLLLLLLLDLNPHVLLLVLLLQQGGAADVITVMLPSPCFKCFKWRQSVLKLKASELCLEESAAVIGLLEEEEANLLQHQAGRLNPQRFTHIGFL